MQVGKKKGSPKKGNQTTTRSKTKQQKQQHKIESLALLSSPVAASCNPKKLSTVSKDQKQAVVNSPERERTNTQVVTETKKNKTIDEKEHSTGSDSTDLPVTEVKMAPFDVQLEHLLTNYFSATGDQHETRQTFIQNDVLTFDLLIGMCIFQILRNMKLKRGNNCVNAFNEGKLKLVNNVRLYCNFLYQDDDNDLAEDPTQWDKADFRKWKSRGYPLSTSAYNASQAGNNVNAANAALNAMNTTGPAS